MAKLIKYTPKLGRKSFLKRIEKGRKKVNLEDYGQLNLFEQGKVVNFNARKNLFELALDLDNKGDGSAEKIYLKSIKQGISVADCYCNLGILMAARGETGKSVNYLTQSLATDPRHIESHYNLANIYFDAGNYSLSINHYDIAREIDPSFPDVYFNLGLAHASLLNYQAATDSFLQYKLVAPDDQEQANLILKQLKSMEG